MSATQHTEQPSAGALAPLSELVLVDRHEAQGRRVRQDERLDHLFEERCDWNRRYGRAGRLAVDSDEMSLTYDELDARANRLARYLRLRGARAGDRVALLFDRPAPSYVAMLATLKIGATYVPLDVGFPTGRLAYIVEDARAHTVLSMSHVADRVEQIELLTASGAELVYVDRAAPLIEEMDPRRLIDAERGVLDNQLAYISYASVSGRPEGVAIDHPSICNFVKVAAEVYGIRPQDRVYQGLTIALDFSVEEIWVPWVCGATLVPRPPGANLLGTDLHEFLRDRRVTALCCVPGVLGTIEDDLPDLRFLLVCGKDCPPELITRWHRPGRRFLSVYGPTEATVTATWTELHPDKPLTIGIPLPTYSTVILDVEDPHRALPHGEIGEIGIAGIGLACGYLNHDDLTDEMFIEDFLGIPANPSGRIYRTGDRGRVNLDGEIEYHGRVDQSTESRGYRIELTEVESLLHVPAVAPAPVSSADLAGPTTGPEGALAEALAALVGREVPVESHFFDDLGADSLVMAQFCARVRKRTDLPAVSMKDVYRFPTIRSLSAALADAESTPMERSLSEVLAGLVGVEVPVESHFFDDLGADSLVMAQFCARVRKRVDLPPVSMRDIYAHATIRDLATAVAKAEPGRGNGSAVEMAPPVGTPRYVLCGVLQVLFLIGSAYLTAVIMVGGYEWISVGTGLVDVYLRSVLFTAVSFLGLCLLPIVAKWVLVGRWRPQQIRVWSLAYLRFWVVKALIRSSPLARFAGSPLYVLYLRALGARIGRGAVIFSPTVPVCTDLLTVGAGTVISKASSFTCYRAHAGMIQTGAVTLGRDVFVGDATVLDIGTSMGDGAQLGHTSSLQPGQAVPAGERWHGSPAQPTTVNYRVVEAADCGAVRRVGYSVLQMLNVLVYLPVGIGVLFTLFAEVPWAAALVAAGSPAFSDWTFYRDALALSFVLFFGSTLAGLLFMVTVPRVLNLALEPDRLYPLYGVHYWIQRVITRTTNNKFLTELFGDSSFVVGYLRLLGYELSRVEQTGSNFGMDVKHDNPFLSSVGSGTVIADGLSIVNADFSNTSFRVSRVSIGAHNFLGNNIYYPAQGRTGDNCLLGTKVMVPVDGEVRNGVGLLGSPCFEIPRSVERDTRFDHLAQGEELRTRLAAKNRHNLTTIGLYLLVRWVHFFGVTLLFLAGLTLYPPFGASAIALSSMLTLLLSTGYFVLVQRVVSGLQAWTPNGCSIYDRGFWRHERFWKVPAVAYLQVFNGTPFKGGIWRLLGVRIGRRVFDDGSFISEKTFVTIGDGCTLNAASIIQCHSQEDGAFKSDLTTIGAGATLGVGAFVHYGVTIGDGAVLAADSFLMKGEEVPPHEWWGGNPAGEIRGDHRQQSDGTAPAAGPRPTHVAA